MNPVIPDDARRQIVQAADRAYDDIRWVVGDSFEVARLVRKLAHECWQAGCEHGQNNRSEAQP